MSNELGRLGAAALSSALEGYGGLSAGEESVFRDVPVVATKNMDKVIMKYGHK